ncbi:MAG: DUF4870 domain-containing protein [Pseudolysinimonas sp.]|uniref:DUF4870 domain-containing protein n=1 Tax=Pseudolysinimonas sp. TaxID=2680009 RepID=UPI00326423E8
MSDPNAPTTPPAYGTPPPPYGTPPGYQMGPAAAVADRGTLTHALGFLCFIPVPLVGILVAGVAMLLSYPSVRARGPIARRTARSGANWGATLLILAIVIAAVQIVLTGIAAANHTTGFLPTGTPLLVLGALAITHVIVTIIGTVKASKGEEFKNPLAIPFYRS